jgi:translocation and assembly module TamA
MSTSSRRQAWINSSASLLLACILQWVPVPGVADTVTVVVEGLSGEALSNAQASLSIQQRSGDETLDAGAIANLHQRAPGEIRRALQPFGYYQSTVSGELVAPGPGESAWLASYRVQAGEKVPVSFLDIQLEGLEATEQQALAATLTLTTGVPLDHRQYEGDKQRLLRQVKDLGYLDAAYTLSRVEVDLDDYRASIALHIAAGPRYVIGPITFEHGRFAPEYLAKYLVLEQGQPFTRGLVSRQRAALSKSGHFQEVNIEQGDALPGEPPAIPLHILLKPYKPNRYRGRLSWGSDTDLGIGADWTRRYLGGHGHQFTLGGTAVQDRDRLAADASYVIPVAPASGQLLELGARHESKDLTFEDVGLDEGGDTRIATNLVSAYWHLPERVWGEFEWERRLGISLVNEDYDMFEVLFGNLPNFAQDIIIDTIGRKAYNTLSPDFEAIVPSLRLVLRRADDPLYIRRGEFYKLELLGSDEALGSNISFWQAQFNSWNIWSLGDSGRLLLRSSLGYTDAKSSSVLGGNFNQLPEYYEFRAGGARSIRGYGFEELLPADAVTGGKHQAVASIEYEHEIIPDWSAAVFLDGGNAFNDFDDIDEKFGTGFGVRWRSPVGVARIDVGFPLDDDHDGFEVYITVGPEF